MADVPQKPIQPLPEGPDTTSPPEKPIANGSASPTPPTNPTPQKQSTISGQNLDALREKILMESTKRAFQEKASQDRAKTQTQAASASQIQTVRGDLSTKPALPQTVEQKSAEDTSWPQMTKSASALKQTTKLPASGIRPLRTFKDDIERTIERQQTSVVSAIAAEETRRAQTTPSKPVVAAKSFFLLGVSSVLILMGTLALITWYLWPKPNTEVAIREEIPSFIFTDNQEPVDVTQKSGSSFMSRLISARDRVNIQLGAITHLYLVETYDDPSTGKLKERLVSTIPFLEKMEAHAPASLQRSLSKEMMLGVYESQRNEPFLIFTTTYYDNAFAGMLEWEKTMHEDLSPLFGEPITITSLPTQATSSGPSAATTTTSTSTQEKATSSLALTAVLGGKQTTAFHDEVIENIEVRTLRDENGVLGLLYAFVTQNVIVITTSEQSFREILKRYQNKGR